MKLSSPLPQPLPKECQKAARIFKSFVDSGNNGLDGVIPRHVLENARGFAIFTVIKAGFLFSARAGSGIVIAKLDDGSWSAPSAIGTAGLGVGGQAGAEMTDFLVVLNSKAAVRSFMSAGSLTLGGNMSIALGPLGRNGEASGSLNTSGKVAAMYSYSKTRGLFGGVSIEGSVLVERQDANALAYNSNVTAKMLLSGNVDVPTWATPLISTLESCVGIPGGRKWVNDSLDAYEGGSGGYAFEGIASPGLETSSSSRKKGHTPSASVPNTKWNGTKDNGSYFNDDFSSVSPVRTRRLIDDGSATKSFPEHFESDFINEDTSSVGRPELSFRASARAAPLNNDSPFNDPSPSNSSSRTGFGHQRTVSSLPFYGSYRRDTSDQGKRDDLFMTSSVGNFDDVGDIDNPRELPKNSLAKPHIAPKAALTAPLKPSEGVGRAIALFDFKGQEFGDLSFRKGQVIVITKKSNKTDDWWTGKLDGREGIFPANFVEVV